MSELDATSANSNIFMTFWFPILSFCISIGVAISFFASDKLKERNHQKQVKEIIDNNIEQLTKICNRLYVDLDDIHGISSDDERKAKEISTYFERQVTRLEMLRINIGNQLTYVKGDKSYISKIKNVLNAQDLIMEKCNRPDIPIKYKLSLWKENKEELQENTGKIIEIAKNLKIITSV